MIVATYVSSVNLCCRVFEVVGYPQLTPPCMLDHDSKPCVCLYRLRSDSESIIDQRCNELLVSMQVPPLFERDLRLRSRMAHSSYDFMFAKPALRFLFDDYLQPSGRGWLNLRPAEVLSTLM